MAYKNINAERKFYKRGREGKIRNYLTNSKIKTANGINTGTERKFK